MTQLCCKHVFSPVEYFPVNIDPTVETHHEKTWYPYSHERKVHFSRNETSEEDNAEGS